MKPVAKVDDFGDVPPEKRMDCWLHTYCHVDRTQRLGELYKRHPELLEKYTLYRAGFYPYYRSEGVVEGQPAIILRRTESPFVRTIYFLTDKKGEALKVIERANCDPVRFCGHIITKELVEDFEHGHSIEPPVKGG